MLTSGWKALWHPAARRPLRALGGNQVVLGAEGGAAQRPVLWRGRLAAWEEDVGVDVRAQGRGIVPVTETRALNALVQLGALADTVWR
ncbi:MAG: hypothetical protein AAFR52_15605 [Pseudomonadota bacterium]